MKPEEELEIVEKCKNNVIIQNVLSAIRMLSPIGDIIDTNINKIVDDFIEEKKNAFLDNILNDKELILTEDVNTVEFIMNFAKTLEAVNKLSNNDKINYFSNLLKNGYMKGRKIESDDYEEKLNILCELTNREINYIIFLYEYEKNNAEKQNNYWYNFMAKFEEEFKIDKYEVYEIYKRISSKGLLHEELELESKEIEKGNSYGEYDQLRYGTLDLKYFATNTLLKDLIELIK